MVPSDRTRGNRHKLEQRKLQLNIRKSFFPLRVTEPWPRLPREAVESPSLEIFQTRLAAVLCSLLWVTLLGQGVGLGDPQRSLPTPAMLGFWDSMNPERLHGAGVSFTSVSFWNKQEGSLEQSLAAVCVLFLPAAHEVPTDTAIEAGSGTRVQHQLRALRSRAEAAPHGPPSWAP